MSVQFTKKKNNGRTLAVTIRNPPYETCGVESCPQAPLPLVVLTNEEDPHYVEGARPPAQDLHFAIHTLPSTLFPHTDEDPHHVEGTRPPAEAVRDITPLVLIVLEVQDLCVCWGGRVGGGIRRMPPQRSSSPGSCHSLHKCLKPKTLTPSRSWCRDS